MESTGSEMVQASEPLAASTAKQWSSIRQPSVADGMYVLVAFAGALIRFSNLGDITLSPSEAESALEAWQFLHTGPNLIVSGSPAYLTLTSLLMPFLGISDGIMRLVPALFGLGLVFLPWLLRDRIGPIGALVTAALFAASPLYAAVSRTAGGDAIALFAILMVLIAGLRLRENGSDLWLYTLSGSLGLGFASAPLFYSGLITLMIARAVQQVVSPGPGRTYQLERSKVINAVFLGGFILLALSTRFFTHLSGFGSAAQIFADWLVQFGWQGNILALLSPFLVLGRYEIVLVPLGIFAIIWAIWRNRPLGTLFIYWLLGAMILMLLQRAVLSNTLIVPLAGYLLLGLASNHLLKIGRSSWTLAVSAIVVLLGAVVLVNIARFLRVSIEQQQVSILWITILAFTAVVFVIYYLWTDHEIAILQGIWLGILVLLLIYQWGTAWNLTHVTANDPRERWVEQAADDEVVGLISTLQDISRIEANSDNDIPVFSAVDSAVLRWYLRDFRRAEFGQTIPPGARHEVIISPIAAIQPSLGEDYLGTDFGLLRRNSTEPSSSQTPVLDALRWILFHESSRGIIEERVILWIRADLAQPR